jgi:hypothetical protein
VIAANTDAFGAMEASARRLMTRARELTSIGQALDVLHVILAALPAEGDEAVTSSLVLSALQARIERPELLRTLLSVELRLHGEAASEPGAVTEALRRCASLWRHASAERNVRITDAVVLWGVLSDDNAATHVLQELGVDRTALLHELEETFQEVVPPHGAEWHPQSRRVVPLSVPADKVAAYKLAADLTHIVRPTKGLRYVGMHAVLMSTVLNVLGSCEPPQIVVLAGRNGTPLHETTLVLADRLASGELFTGQRERLRHAHAVHILNIETVAQLADMEDEPDPQDVLEMAMQQAVEDQAVLVLDRLEDLKDTDAEERSLRAQLSDPGDTLVLGLYELSDRGEVGVEEALGLHNVRQIAARPYSAERTKALIFEYYVPEWQTQGFTFTEDAFDSVIALEPGAWIELKRKTLPYLAVGLARDVMETIKGGTPLIRDTARMALDALTALRQERATTDERIRDQFSEVLHQAREDIEALIAQPNVKVENGLCVITRAHLIAQLICPNDSEFHYPGHAPAEARHYNLEDLPPDM